jgi:hypothetical protein
MYVCIALHEAIFGISIQYLEFALTIIIICSYNIIYNNNNYAQSFEEEERVECYAKMCFLCKHIYFLHQRQAGRKEGRKEGHLLDSHPCAWEGTFGLQHATIDTILKKWCKI